MQLIFPDTISHFRLLAVLLECLYANFITYCNREVADMQDKVERLLTEDGLKSIGCTINGNN